jgi:Zn-dependent protease
MPDTDLVAPVLAELRAPTKKKVLSGSALFTLSAVGFVAVLALTGSRGPMDAVCLVAVLLLHELGHAAAMRVFGYGDVKIFFVPFLGAMTSGLKGSAPAWQQAVVLLMGPVPGLVLGFVLRAVWRHGTPGVLPTTLAPLLVGVNALNLLPIEPLDGGRLAELLLFGGMPRAQVVFAAVVTLVGLVALRPGPVWTFALAGFVAMLTMVRWRAAKMATIARAELARDWASLPADVRDADDELLTLLARSDPTPPGRIRDPKVRTRTTTNLVRIAYDMLRFVPMRRAVGVPLGVLFVGTTGVLAFLIAGNMRRHPSTAGTERRQISAESAEWARTFVADCVARCGVASPTAACVSACTCTARDLEAHLNPDELKSTDPSPELTQRTNLSSARCSGDLVDSQFLNGCELGCSDGPGPCARRCACLLAAVRGPGDRAASTLWMERYLGPTPTEAGKSRLSAVAAECDGPQDQANQGR